MCIRDREYEDYLTFQMEKNLEIRKMPFPNVHNVDMDKIDWKSAKDFLQNFLKIPQDSFSDLEVISL